MKLGDRMLENKKIFSKVFLWMAIGLAITFGVGYYVSLNTNMLYNVFSKYYIFLIIAELAVVIILSARIRKMQPTTAKIMFCLYSFITGLTFSSIFVVYDLMSIMYVFGITAVIMLIFGLIGYYTKIDLTKFWIYLFMALIAVIICEIINIFVGSETFNMGITIACLIIFIIYMAFDIQAVKKNIYGIEKEDNLAIYGALELYLDFINVFLRLLELIGKNKD